MRACEGLDGAAVAEVPSRCKVGDGRTTGEDRTADGGKSEKVRHSKDSSEEEEEKEEDESEGEGVPDDGVPQQTQLLHFQPL